MSETTTLSLRERALAAYAQFTAERNAAEAARRQEDHDLQVADFRRLLGVFVEDPMFVGIITSPDGRLHAQIDGVYIGYSPAYFDLYAHSSYIFAYRPCVKCGSVTGPSLALGEEMALDRLGEWLATASRSKLEGLCASCYAEEHGEPGPTQDAPTLAERFEELIREIVREEMAQG